MTHFRCFYRKQELLNTIKKSALANLLGFSALGPLSWFINVNQMDTPAHFFLGLKKKNRHRRILHPPTYE